MERILWETAIEGVLVLTAVALVAALLRDRSAAARHLAWAIGMASLVALPLLEAGLPGWRLPLLPAAPEAAVAGAASPAGGSVGLLFAFWLIGAAAVAGTILVGRSRVWWFARHAVPMDGDAWPALASSLGDHLRLPRRVAIRRSDRVTTPMMWGTFRPVVLLPAEAEAWPERLRRDVLLHELVHVKRHDYEVQLLARLACAVHWFNPLVWAAARQLRLERERACDDHVLEAGAHPCDYAASLLAMARAAGRARRLAAAVPMADPARFGERLAALLDPRRRRAVLRRRTALPAALTAALAVSLVAAARPERRAAPAPPATLADWARAAETTHGIDPAPAPALDPAPAADAMPAARPAPAASARRTASVPPASGPSTVAVYRAPTLRVVLTGEGGSIDPPRKEPATGTEIDSEKSEACDPGESHDSTPRPEPAKKPVQVAAGPAEVTAH